MKPVRWLPTCLLLLACGKVEKQNDDALLETSIVAGSLAGNAFICHRGGEPVALGPVAQMQLSPNGQRVALERDGGVDVVSLTDARSERLTGDDVTLTGARWSDDSERLAYFAGNVPRVTGGADAPEFAVDLELPEPAASFSFRAAEWSRDGKQVAFITAHTGILVDIQREQARIFSDQMVEAYGTPWPLAFSADGRVLAGLENLPEDQRSVVMVDTETLTTRQIVLGFHYTLAGWSSDDAALAVWTEGTVILPRDGGEPLTFPDYGLLSPTQPELAVPDQGLRIVNLVDGSERSLLAAEYRLLGFRWLADGTTLAIRGDLLEHSAYVSAVDGNSLVRGLGVVGPNHWVALHELDHPDSGIWTMNLYDSRAKGAHFSMEFPDEESAFGELIGPTRVRWLHDGRLAFVSDDGLHLATRDGSSNRVLCRGVNTLVTPQAGHLD